MLKCAFLNATPDRADNRAHIANIEHKHVHTHTRMRCASNEIPHARRVIMRTAARWIGGASAVDQHLAIRDERQSLFELTHLRRGSGGHVVRTERRVVGVERLIVRWRRVRNGCRACRRHQEIDHDQYASIAPTKNVVTYRNSPPAAVRCPMWVCRPIRLHRVWRSFSHRRPSKRSTTATTTATTPTT